MDELKALDVEVRVEEPTLRRVAVTFTFVTDAPAAAVALHAGQILADRVPEEMDALHWSVFYMEEDEEACTDDD